MRESKSNAAHLCKQRSRSWYNRQAVAMRNNFNTSHSRCGLCAQRRQCTLSTRGERLQMKCCLARSGLVCITHGDICATTIAAESTVSRCNDNSAIEIILARSMATSS